MEYFTRSGIKALVSSFGNFLDIDDRTYERNALHAARACVEIDVTKTIPAKIWVHVGEEGFFQDIVVEGGMAYCMKCRIHGHDLLTCKKSAKSNIRVTEAAKASKELPPPVGTENKTPQEKKNNADEGWTKVSRRRVRKDTHQINRDLAIIDNLENLTTEAGEVTMRRSKGARLDHAISKDNNLAGAEKGSIQDGNIEASSKVERNGGTANISKKIQTAEISQKETHQNHSAKR